MNSKGFHKILEDPKLLDKDSLTELERLLEAYPYSENIRILYALNLLQQNDFRYQQNLTKAAFYASDRKKLRYIVEFMLHQEENIYELEEFDVLDESDVEETNTNIIHEKVADEGKSIFSSDLNIESLEINTKPEDSLIFENKKESTKLKEAEKRVFKEYAKTETRVDLNEKEKQKKEVRNKTELLLLVKKRLAEIEANKKEEQRKQAEQASDSEITSKMSLIDQFIKTQPSISRPDKNEFFDPLKEAIDSTTDEDDFFVTETLARIHGDQGNIQKATEIYQKLILKFPEKSSYFAALIQDLSKK